MFGKRRFFGSIRFGERGIKENQLTSQNLRLNNFAYAILPGAIKSSVSCCIHAQNKKKAS
jgi:hypothetical protein